MTATRAKTPRSATAAEALEVRQEALQNPDRPRGKRTGTVPPTPQETCDLLAVRIREARESQGLSRAEAYRQGGPSPQEAWAYESGTRSISLGMLCLLAHLYRKPVWWFLYEKTPTDPEADRYPLRDRWRGGGGDRRQEP